MSDKLRLPTGTILAQAEEGVATNTFSEKTHEFVLPPHMPAAMYTLRLIKHEGNPIMHIGTSRHFLHSKSDDGAESTASEGTVSHKFEGRTPAALYMRVECLEGTACSYTVKGDITSCIEGKYAADHPTCDSVTLRALIDVQCADGFFAYKKECLKELPGCGFGGPCLPTQIPKEEA